MIGRPYVELVLLLLGLWKSVDLLEKMLVPVTNKIGWKLFGIRSVEAIRTTTHVYEVSRDKAYLVVVDESVSVDRAEELKHYLRENGLDVVVISCDSARVFERRP